MSAEAIHALVFIIAANSTPVLLTRLMGDRWAFPIDAGKTFFDGRPILGRSKSWRGLLGAVLVCALIAPLLGFSPALGAGAAMLAMSGDMISSFSKRRLGLKSSAQAPLLDQVPEALLPALGLKATLHLSWEEIVLVTFGFALLEIVLSVIFFKLGVRKQPY